MGQSPGRPLQLAEHSLANDLMHTPPLEELLHYSRLLQEASAIDHLPDLSPFPRQFHLAPPLGFGRPAHGSRPPSYRSSRSEQHRAAGTTGPPAASSRGAAAEGRARSARVGRRKTIEVRHATRRAKKTKKPQKSASREGGVPGQQGFHAVLPIHAREAPLPPLPTSARIIPRIDIVESSPLLDGCGSPLPSSMMQATDAGDVEPASSPSMPNFARSPSMPAVLPDIIPEYLLSPRPALSRPCTAPSPGASDTTFAPLLLPLPGTPLAEEAPLIDFADFQSAQSRSQGHSYPRDPSSAGSEQRQTAWEQESVVTQEIRILRVVNPDPPESTSTLSRPVSPVPAPTLAEKRHITSPPAPIRVAYPIGAAGRDASRLSPSTPSSSASPQSGLFSKGSSQSSPVTSLPPSPASPTKKAQAALGLGIPKASSLVKGDTELERLRGARSPAPPSPSKKADKRRVSAPSSKNALPSPVSSRAKKARAHSISSHGSSEDGDRSGTESSAAGLSPSQLKSSRPRFFSAGNGRSGGSKVKSTAPQLLALPPLATPFELKVSPSPPQDDALVPPRSPRPPNTPRLCDTEHRGSQNEGSPDLPAKKLPSVPCLNTQLANEAGGADPIYAPLPPASPLKMDWFTTDLLLRCGIQPSSLSPLPASPTRTNAPLLSPAAAEHPSVLQPRRASSPLPLPPPSPSVLSPNVLAKSTSGLPLPAPGTPLGLNLLDEKDDPFLSASLIPSTPRSPAGTALDKSSGSESVFARRERKKREKAARYAAFAALAQMAVESPHGNPFVGADGQGGAVRLGEYKRGFNGREIVRWARNVKKAEEMEAMDEERVYEENRAG